MSSFTYESKNQKEMYETYEWDNVWIDHANDMASKRVLYIGDSISCAVRHIATALSDEKILFDGFGTSKSVDNPYFGDALKVFMQQEGKRDAVLFNNGLHGWHLDDEAEYKAHYEEMVKFILDEIKETPLILVLTTHVSDDEREKRVIKRNEKALEIAEKYKLAVVDLYKTSLKNKNLICADGVHYEKEGSTAFAQTLVDYLNGVLQMR